MKKHILIISPIPSHPQFQGNSARIYRLNQMFQKSGYKVHFVYFGMEGLTESQKQAMAADWDYFYYVRPEGPAAKPSYVDYFDIDDWYDQKVSILVEQLCKKWNYNVCLVNYVWFSKALEVVPDDVYKVIDTHDVFGDRHIVAHEAGLEPVWFYTTKELEAYALQRADLIIAIQDQEKAYFKSITTIPVEVIGYVTPLQTITSSTPERNKIRIGYIGSGNPFNINSILTFQNVVKCNPSLFDKFEFILGGSICKSFENNNDVFEIVGMVDDLDDFYRNIDIAVNPMLGGTGLKIKSLEALSFGKPLIATYDAMIGISTTEPFQQCENIDEMVDKLMSLDDQGQTKLIKSSKHVFDSYNMLQIQNFKKIFGYELMDFQIYKKRLSEWAAAQEPVFIVGPERSGTSLLFQQVSNHPDFCDFSHATVETFCFVKPWLLLEQPSPENFEMRVYLGQKNLPSFQESIAPLIERNRMLSDQGMSVPYLSKANRSEIWFERRYKHVLQAFFYHSWKHLGEKRLVEKTPAHIRCASEILDTFPNAKLLICTREPGEIIASHKKRYKKEIELGKSHDDPSIAWLSHSTENYLKYFSSIDKTIQQLLTDVSASVKVIPYGDLTSSPQQVLKQVYEFIGVDYIDPNSLVRQRSEQAWDPLLNKAPQKNEVDLTEEMTPDEIKLVEDKKQTLSAYWK